MISSSYVEDTMPQRSKILNNLQVKLAGAESLSDVKQMLKLWTNDAKGTFNLMFI